MTQELGRTPYRKTEVSVERSQHELRKLLARYGVNDLQFTYRREAGIQIMFARPDEVGHMSAYRLRAMLLSPDDQGERQAMRMLFWWTKHKVEAIDFGISDFETEWLPYQLIAGRDGSSTVAEQVMPQLRAGGTNIDPFQPALPSGE